jgi:hypothetical protein
VYRFYETTELLIILIGDELLSLQLSCLMNVRISVKLSLNSGGVIFG